MIHPKALHFPSGFPMTRSPPLFVCSSPGPDPYRSHDNVYEELGPPRDSDVESEPPLHSDDDFAEDELSLPGERSFQKSSSDNTTVATIYHERQTPVNGSTNNSNNSNNSSANSTNFIERALNERNSLLSSTSSGTSTTNNENNRTGSGGSHASSAGSRNNNSSPLVFRNRKIYNRDTTTPNRKGYAGGGSGGGGLSNNTVSNNGDDLNTATEQSDIVVPTIYSDRVNIMTLPYSTTNLITNNNNNNLINNNNSHNNSISNLNSNNNLSNNSTNNNCNGQLLHNNELNSNNSVSTIYRDRMLPPVTTHHYNFNNHHRSRTNPRPHDRRLITNSNRIMNCINPGVPPPPLPPTQSAGLDSDQGYGYTEPVFHEGLLYDACISSHLPNRSTPVYHPYILPEFTTFRTLGNPASSVGLNQPIYSRDSSFGSDSGYSHHTQTSNRGGGGVGDANRGGGCGSNGGGGGFIGATFGWGRRSKNKSQKNKTFEGS